MKLTDMSKEELEQLSYDEIALLVLQEAGKKMKLRDILVKINKILELSDDNIDNELMDFFETLSTNKKFIMLKNGYWDLQSRHKLDVVFENDEEDEEIDAIEEDEEDSEPIEDEEDIFDDIDDETDDQDDDELADFVVLDNLEDENNI